jgi:hypothetical protein
MGGRTLERIMDAQDNGEKVYRGNSLCNGLWGRGGHPLEVGMPTTKTTEFEVETNEETLRKDLDLLEEKRDLAMVRLASYQQKMKREHDKSIRPRTIRVGDLVLRKVMANTREPNDEKLGPNWEGPYKVLSLAGQGSYKLEDMNGKPIPRPWNTCNLRKYFF